MSSALFNKFFDDAAIFPPGLADLDVAVRDHLRRAKNPVADAYIGPLILPVEKIAEAAELAGGEAIDFSVVVSVAKLGEVEEVIGELKTKAPQARIVAIEAKPSGGDASLESDIEAVQEFGRRFGVDTYLELASAQATDAILDQLAKVGVRLKFRTGGIERRFFPQPEELVGVIKRAIAHSVPFKLTAGLHRAMRYTNPATGFEHFGFLNVAAATAVLERGGSEEEALSILQSDDRDAVVAVAAGDEGAQGGAITQAPKWRSEFLSFGTCDVNEPVETLHELDLVGQEVVSNIA